MSSLKIVAGIMLLVGGGGGLWSSLLARRRGDPWRGMALACGAFLLYGALSLAGVLFNDTVLGTVLLWLIVAATWGGLWLVIRARPRAAD